LEIPLDRADNLADVLTLGRVLGRVWIDGKDVGAVMVSEGLATKTKQK
jgi:endonuclease YncB( thermonuclease family)